MSKRSAVKGGLKSPAVMVLFTATLGSFLAPMLNQNPTLGTLVGGIAGVVLYQVI